jgi:hypothetical protein
MNSFSVGGVLSRSFSIWLKNLLPFFVLSAIINAPALLFVYLLQTGAITMSNLLVAGLLAGVLAMVFGLIGTGAMTYGVFEQLRGGHASIGKCISVGFSRLFPILGVGLLAGLCLLLGFVALIVPFFILMCMFYVAVPAAVVERPGITGALKRSAELTSGYKWSIFGIIFLLGVINKVSNKIIESIFSGSGDVGAFALVTLAVAAFLGALGSVASAVAYHDLRVAKEGVATEELARVFD